MNTHCNVQCSRVQFAKRLLEGSSISTPLDPGYEGGRIAAEVLDSCGQFEGVMCQMWP